MAALLGAQPDEIIFTSGATESNNLAILGMARANADRGRHIITSRIEHKAVLDPCKRLERRGFRLPTSRPTGRGGSIRRLSERRFVRTPVSFRSCS